MYDAGVDILISGDEHNYERFAPQNIQGQKQPTRGIRQFVVGTGGADLTYFGPRWRNSEAGTDQTWGEVKVASPSYSWESVPVAGKTYTDSESSPCVTN